MKRNSRNALALLLMLSPLLALPDDGLQAQEDRDFLFGHPKLSISFNMGYGVAFAGSDVFDDYLFKDLTLGRSDFSSALVMGTVGIYLNERMDLNLELGYARSESWSKYREWVDMDDLPIEQNTSLSRIPLTVGLRYYLKDRGREVSRFAWIPAEWTPFVGVGGGRLFYDLEHVGDFIDFADENLSIFGDALESDGRAWTAHVLAGAQFSLLANLFLTGEARYTWAEAEMDHRYWVGFQPIDLSGFQATMGIGVRF